MAACGAFFVTRAKGNLRFTRHRPLPVNRQEGLRSDHLGTLTLAKARAAFPWPLRRVRYFDAESRRDLIFLSNHLEISALTVAGLYKLNVQGGVLSKFTVGPDRLARFVLVVLTRPMGSADQNAPMTPQSQGDVGGFAWADDGVGYSLVGHAAPEALRPIANEVRKQARAI